MKKSFFFLMLLLLAANAYSQDEAPTQYNSAVAQWHFTANSTTTRFGDMEDWVLSVFPTSKKQYICAGYTKVGLGRVDGSGNHVSS